jgi:hypothetical protein
MRTTEGGVARRSQKWLSMNSSPPASHFAFGLPVGVSPFSVSMDRNTQLNQQSRNWNILNWNIRGLNSKDKCNAIKEKIEESSCAVFCIQETKRDHFDHSFIKKLAPKRFNKFEFSPSVGASGGILVGWNNSIFTGETIHNNRFAITIKFKSVHNGQSWLLTTVYGPCQGQYRDDFVERLNNLQIDDEENWMILGDFKFYRSLSNRNRDGGNMNDIMVFNEIISDLGLLEIPLKVETSRGVICSLFPCLNK